MTAKRITIAGRRRYARRTPWLAVGASLFALHLFASPEIDAHSGAQIGLRTEGYSISRTAAGDQRQQLAVVTFITSGTSWTVPSDWNSANNKIECIGPGASGGGGGAGAIGGGGGGAYAASTNQTYTPGHSITMQIGTSSTPSSDGTPTFIKNDANSAVAIQAAQANIRVNGQLGGQASSSIGTTKFSGGDGGAAADDGTGNTVGGGGGGAAGPHGAGNNGVIGGTGGGNGGSGDAGFGGAGGTSGGNGGNGTEFDASHGCGGGGAQNLSSTGGNGGAYGGGGSGNTTSNSGGTGGAGLIVITYTPAPKVSGNMPMLGM